ncbi:MAG TPA: outer membrane beta-barrel protein [bacterium]|nr:outer membrane beta-barrel protein [bacterium]
MAKLAAGAMLVAGLLLPTAAQARVGDARAGLFVGTTTTSVQNYNTFGVAFGGTYGYEFAQDRVWTIGGTFASTEGNTTDTTGNPVTLTTSTAEFQTGLVAYFNRNASSVVIPYVGAGLSVLNYSFDFPGTTVGTTAGTAPGIYGQVGVELRLTRNFTLIPQFGVQVHSIKTQTGATTGLLSGGLVFTLRITS